MNLKQKCPTLDCKNQDLCSYKMCCKRTKCVKGWVCLVKACFPEGPLRLVCSTSNSSGSCGLREKFNCLFTTVSILLLYNSVIHTATHSQGNFYANKI